LEKEWNNTAEDQAIRGGIMPQTKVQLASGWDEFAAAMRGPDTECPGEFANVDEAINYLQSVLGDDYLDEVSEIRKHPFRPLMFLSWPAFAPISWIGLATCGEFRDM
jgi:hypothetical protein